jgi:hypothetical protein
MERNAAVDKSRYSEKVADYAADPDKALNELCESLLKNHPPSAAASQEPVPPIEQFLDYPTTMVAYDHALLQDFRANLRDDAIDYLPAGLSDAGFLRRAGLVGESGHLNGAGVLLLTQRPTHILASARVQCVIYRGNTRAAKRARSIQFEGNIAEQITRAIDFVGSSTSLGEHPRPGLARSATEFAYPMIAVREIIANALVHRDYGVKTANVHVRVFDDRMEVTSPGTWGAGALSSDAPTPLDELAAESRKRNYRLAQALYWIKYVEADGSGIETAADDCANANAPRPTVEERDSTVKVTLWPRSRRIGVAPPNRPPLLRANVPVGVNVRSPAQLMRARSAVVPFVGRAPLASELDEWMGRPDPFLVYVVAGQGGSGKTRLGVDLCMKAASRGWVSGLLSPSVNPAEVLALAHLASPLLIVVDYAESRTEQLEVLLPFLASEANAPLPVRVLLLVRASPRLGHDWRTLLRRRVDHDLEQILDETEVHVLDDAPLTGSERGALYAAAVEAFAARVGRVPTAVEVPPVNLSDTAFANPLLIVMAAYLAVHPVHDRDAAFPASRAALLAELAAHEDAYWLGSAKTAHLPIVAYELRARVVALATLAGADSQAEATHLLRLLPELVDAPAERLHEVARWMRRQYPGPQWWNPLKPDLLAEYLVAQHLTSLPRVLAGVLRRENPAALAQPLELYARAGADHPQLREALEPILGECLIDLCRAAIDQAANQPEVRLLLGVTSVASALARLLGVLDIGTKPMSAALDLFRIGANQILGPLTLTLTSRLADHLRDLAMADPAAYEPDLASALNNLSVRLGEAGQREDGLSASQEAVQVYRRLAAANPAAYEPDLASALNNLSVRLGEANRNDIPSGL